MKDIYLKRKFIRVYREMKLQTVYYNIKNGSCCSIYLEGLKIFENKQNSMTFIFIPVLNSHVQLKNTYR